MFVRRAVLSRLGLGLAGHAGGLPSVGLVSRRLYRALIRRLVGSLNRLFLLREVNVLGVLGRFKQRAQRAARIRLLAFYRHVAGFGDAVIQRAGGIAYVHLVGYDLTLNRGLYEQQGARHFAVARVRVEDVANGLAQASLARDGAQAVIQIGVDNGLGSGSNGLQFVQFRLAFFYLCEAKAKDCLCGTIR